MSLASACLWTLARTAVLCLLAWPLCVAIERWVQGVADNRRSFALVVLLVPCLFPELLVGYTYRHVALSSSHLAEWLCAGLLFIRIVPIGVIALLASPPVVIGAAAVHCRWILLRTKLHSWTEWRRFALCIWYGPIQRAAPAIGLMSLIAFQEFELAALLQSASWTDWFVAAQRLGLDRSEMLRHSLWPVAMQLPLLIVALSLFTRDTTRDETSIGDAATPLSRMPLSGVYAYLVMAATCGCLIPVAVLGRNLPGGMIRLGRQHAQWSGLVLEIFVAIAVSVCAGLTTWAVSGLWMRQGDSLLWQRWSRQWLLVPGLVGSLLLSLLTVTIFQQTWLRPWYDTPLPWTLSLIIWLIPRAVLLRLWLDATTSTDGVHLAELLADCDRGRYRSRPSSRRPATRLAVRPSVLLFRLRDQPQLLSSGLLCYWAYLDLSTAYLLAPSSMPSGLVRLYNFMHFGRSAALSAEAFLFFGTPLVLICLLSAVLHWLRR
jgi:hypothetical protein